MKLVFFDLETGGLDPAKHPITQIAAIAVDDQLNEIDAFEAKVIFDLAAADEQALKVGRYDPEVWKLEALSADQAIAEFSAFLALHAEVRMISQRTGRAYFVAQLVGYNANFDQQFLSRLYRSHDAFLPASLRVMCLLQRMLWHFHELSAIPKPEDFKLGTVCAHWGIAIDAHDALGDCRATADLYRYIRKPRR